MPVEIQPPELAELLDVAERPRTGGWSLRSALVRYAEGNPVRVSQVIELVRRIEAGLHPHAKQLAADGPALWAAATTSATVDGSAAAQAVGLLQVSRQLDELAEALAAWADDRHGAERPDAAVDATVADIGARLDDLGIPREDPEQRRPRSRG